MAALKDRRILELALRGLEAERDVIVAEISEIRAKLGGSLAVGRRRRATKAVKKKVARRVKKTGKRVRKMSAAQKKALSKKMKEAWARRKAAG